jgi:hypothetical protein
MSRGRVSTAGATVSAKLDVLACPPELTGTTAGDSLMASGITCSLAVRDTIGLTELFRFT